MSTGRASLERIKAVTVRQPWASLIAMGAKTVETRSWRMTYRGPLIIHSAQSMSGRQRRLTDAHRRRYALPVDLPLGACIAVVDLIDCIPVEELGHLSVDERAFGDYSPGRFGWVLSAPRALPEPIEAVGRLGLWTCTDPRVLRGIR